MRCLAALAAALAVVPTSLQHPFPPTCTGASVPGTPEYAGDYLHRIISVKGGKYGVGGLYYASEDGKLTNETTFERFDQSWRATWTGCAWQLSRAYVDVDSTCVDDNTAASLLFVVDDNDAMCSHASAIGYCAISYFKAVCPKSCKAFRSIDDIGLANLFRACFSWYGRHSRPSAMHASVGCLNAFCSNPFCIFFNGDGINTRSFPIRRCMGTHSGLLYLMKIFS